MHKISLFLITLSFATIGSPARIINGIDVPPGMFDQVVVAKINGSTCSATQVGPKTILVAAHCGKSGDTVQIESLNQTLTGTLHVSPRYPGVDHDLAVVITQSDLQTAPLTIGQGANIGEKVILLGHGCTDPSGADALKGLRMGEGQVTSHANFDFVSEGSAVCFGDSGGPALQRLGGGYIVQGIHSKGNIKDTSYHTNLSSPASQEFLAELALTQNVAICGVNALCEEAVMIQGPVSPRCELTADPAFVELGQSIQFTLAVRGLADSIQVETLGVVDAPTGGFEFTLTPGEEGVHELLAEVSGPGGSDTCHVRYGVK